MQVRFNTRVDKVLVREGAAVGVRLADGTEISAAVVVSNINAKFLYSRLIGLEYLPPLARRGVQSYAYSKAVPMIYLGWITPRPWKRTTMIASRRTRAIAIGGKRGVSPPARPALRVDLLADAIRPSLAPVGKHVVNLTRAFYRLSGTDWDAEKPAYIERTLKYFSKFAIPGLMEHVEVVDCATPLDFERQLLLPEGAIYSLQQDLPAMAVLRPAAKSKSIRGLYLTGSSTHPGGGVPTTIASGLIAARLIERCEA